jgi:cytochrome c553
MKKWIIVLATLLLTSAVVVAGDAPAKAQTCIACHGASGVSSNPQWPNLAGQNTLYFAAQMRAFRDGQRSNPIMLPFVSGLTDADIDALANWYAAQQRATAANGDSALVATGENLAAYCNACHGNHGDPVTSEWPIIVGQHAPYLQKQLADFKSGERVNSHMQAAIARFGEPEFAALAAYYSQHKP